MPAASSVALNIAEAQKSDGGNMKARFFTAAGSANETRAALRVAVGWRHVTARQRLDHIVAILWKLTPPLGELRSPANCRVG